MINDDITNVDKPLPVSNLEIESAINSILGEEPKELDILPTLEIFQPMLVPAAAPMHPEQEAENLQSFSVDHPQSELFSFSERIPDDIFDEPSLEVPELKVKENEPSFTITSFHEIEELAKKEKSIRKELIHRESIPEVKVGLACGEKEKDTNSEIVSSIPEDNANGAAQPNNLMYNVDSLLEVREKNYETLSINTQEEKYLANQSSKDSLTSKLENENPGQYQETRHRIQNQLCTCK